MHLGWLCQRSSHDNEIVRRFSPESQSPAYGARNAGMAKTLVVEGISGERAYYPDDPDATVPCPRWGAVVSVGQGDASGPADA